MLTKLQFSSKLKTNCRKSKKISKRNFHGSNVNNGQKVLVALYEGYEAGKRNPKILGCVQNELGLRKFLEERGHKLVVTSDKDGEGSVLEKNLHDADVVISQPFWPAYLTRRRINMAPKLKLAVTAGVGSDHVDLVAACERNITVAEVTGCNVVSVAEHVVMQILALVRNYIPAYKQVINGEWKIAEIADKAYDLEGRQVGTVGAGRIGFRVLQRLHPFDVGLHYTELYRLPKEVEEKYNLIYHETVEDMVKVCDVVTINCPLHSGTENLFDSKMISKMKKGSYLVNTARGKIVNAEALRAAVESGHIEGYSGDVWFPQPAPVNHPWRQMPRHALTPHYSGTTLDAQARYAAGVKQILTAHFDGKPQTQEFLIAQGGKIVSPAYLQGNTTSGSY
jgi:formate dehydrogenase